jgi:hypothetical protein
MYDKVVLSILNISTGVSEVAIGNAQVLLLEVWGTEVQGLCPLCLLTSRRTCAA